MADDKQTEVYYRLARSVVRITGSITHDFDPKTSKARASATSDVEVDVEAEPRLDWRCKLPMGSRFMRDKQFELTFTNDGRLSSSKATVTGAGSAVLEAGIRIATFVGTSLFRMDIGLRRSDSTQEEDCTFEQVLAGENEGLHDRRQAYRDAIVELQTALAKGAASTASEPTVANFRDIRLLEGVLEYTRAEAEKVEAEYDAWVTQRFPTRTEEHVFKVGSDDLPYFPLATPTKSFTVNDLAEPLRSTATQLGVVVARFDEVEEDKLNWTPEGLEDETGIWFRTARPTNLAIYERELASKGEFRLRSVTPSWVVDSKSQLGFLRFDSGIFDKQTGAIGFGDSGALTTLSSTDESPARQLSTAFAAAPGQIKEALEQAASVSESVAKLRARGAERRLADLERRRKLLEAEIAEKGVLATRQQREELERLRVQAEIADARKKLQPEPEPSASPYKDLEQQLARAKLELDLKKVEIGLA